MPTSRQTVLASSPSVQFDADIQAALDARGCGTIDVEKNFRALDMHVVYRADLQMSPGKLAVQCAHAFQLALEQARQRESDIEERYKASIHGHGFKDLRRVANLAQLLGVYRAAQEAGFPCALVIDCGHVRAPYFDGNPVITAVGIGPAWRDIVSKIAHRLERVD